MLLTIEWQYICPDQLNIPPFSMPLVLGMGGPAFSNRYDTDTIPTIFSGIDTKF